MKLIRITQEREALYELLPEANPDHFPWENMEDDLVGIENRDPAHGVVERWTRTCKQGATGALDVMVLVQGAMCAKRGRTTMTND
eukprot:3223881-Amphidinium_carterae.1